MKHLALATLLLAFASAGTAQAQILRPLPRSTTSTVVAPRVDWSAWRTSGVTSPSQPHRALPAPAPTAPGLVACAVTENGAPASAFVEVRYQGRVVASGNCGARIEVPGGDYDATVTLTSIMGRPQRTVPLHVPENGVGTATVDFPVSIVEVRFTRGGQPVFGQAVLVVDGQRVGSVGAAIPARVASGHVTVIARVGSETRTYELDLAPTQRRMITAAF